MAAWSPGTLASVVVFAADDSGAAVVTDAAGDSASAPLLAMLLARSAFVAGRGVLVGVAFSTLDAVSAGAATLSVDMVDWSELSGEAVAEEWDGWLIAHPTPSMTTTIAPSTPSATVRWEATRRRLTSTASL